MLNIIIIGGVVLIILLIIGVVVSSNSERAVVEQRLAQYLDDDKQDIDSAAQNSVLTEWVSKRVEKTSFGDRIARDLARADLKFKAGEYFILIIVSILLGGLVIWFLGNQHWASAVIGAVAGAFAPGIYVRRQQKQRLQKFNDQLSDMLNLMVNGLRAGYSTMQAMEAVSKELPSPINDEFRRVVQEMQIGIPMETALDNLLRRIPSDDLDFVVTAINVQREVGGNLSEILDTISFTIRERVRIKGEVRVLTAQVRTSGSVLSLIPFFLVLILWFLNPEYILAVTAGGPIITAAIICVVLGLIFTGYFIMMKIADIEV
ncbi:MAG TPA: type II secretion system F family protein [Anaerolineales bacterium]|nr:type II secretion system F family protein [Anaerolineales bacterium]HMV96645.1 type II secretion system F family protein [Anaerolineales bacterium]HMX19996.1 type II secretion system F family protein [Anaerolineales bacterium]HMX74611.1 type II secretion system F family protein [Anaerolineales bacterium]HMZ43382.1 type II secretion system F family protein [Anaerolineales bacterium]